jgi:hypothetical protein
VGKNPQASLYRMYECIAVNDHGRLRVEARAFFHLVNWPVADIPDPDDPDPARYAMLAVIVKLMVADFNDLIEQRFPRGVPTALTVQMADELRAKPIVREELPGWVANVPIPSDPVIIPLDNGEIPDEKCRSPLFQEMNIVVMKPYPLLS